MRVDPASLNAHDRRLRYAGELGQVLLREDVLGAQVAKSHSPTVRLPRPGCATESATKLYRRRQWSGTLVSEVGSTPTR